MPGRPNLCAQMCAAMMGAFSSAASAVLALFHGGTTMVIGGRRVRVGRRIAEGGFSYVFEAHDLDSGRDYALKKMISQGPEQSTNIRWEIRVHQAFSHPNLMPLIGSHSVRDERQSRETIYLLFPLFGRGSLEDQLAAKRPAREAGQIFFLERDALRIFVGVCEGLLQFERHAPPWAHRDIKPANVLVSDDGVPVLMDFGSAAEAAADVSTRAKALHLQDWAAENCSMPYRAPELFDVHTNAAIDGRTDVWSLGCMLYAMCFGYSPFECEFNAEGKPRVVECSYLRVINGASYPQPQAAQYSKDFMALLRSMLVVNAEERSQLADVYNTAHRLLAMQSGDAALNV